MVRAKFFFSFEKEFKTLQAIMVLNYRALYSATVSENLYQNFAGDYITQRKLQNQQH